MRTPSRCRRVPPLAQPGHALRDERRRPTADDERARAGGRHRRGDGARSFRHPGSPAPHLRLAADLVRDEAHDKQSAASAHSVSRHEGKRANGGAHVRAAISGCRTMDACAPGRTSQSARPRSRSRAGARDPHLVVPETAVDQPRFPVVDIHNHVGRWLSPHVGMARRHGLRARQRPRRARASRPLSTSTVAGTTISQMNLERYDLAHPGRFVTFCHLDWSALRRLGVARRCRGRRDARRAAPRRGRQGARGVKVWKNLGLGVRDGSGRLVMPDDPRVVAALRGGGRARAAGADPYRRPGGVLRSA